MRPNFTADADRWLWGNITQTSDGSCWLWGGTPHHSGYGTVKWNGIQTTPHRVAYILTYGLPRKDVLHRCGNRLCCNPSHLYDGDDIQNAADRKAHGRTHQPVGEANSMAKLTRAQVDEIRASKDPISTLVERYGVSKSHVYRLRRGDRWS